MRPEADPSSSKLAHTFHYTALNSHGGVPALDRLLQRAGEARRRALDTRRGATLLAYFTPGDMKKNELGAAVSGHLRKKTREYIS